MPIPNAHVNGCGCRLLQVVGAYQECCWVYRDNKKPPVLAGAWRAWEFNYFIIPGIPGVQGDPGTPNR